MRKTLLLIFSILITAAVSAQKLTGSMDAYGAWNFGTGHKENAALKLHLDSTLYYVHVGVRGGHNYAPTTEYTSIANENAAKKDMSLKSDVNEVRSRKWNIGADLDFGYYLTNHDLLKINAQYSYDDIHKEEKISSNRYQSNINSEQIIHLDTLLGNQNDHTWNRQHTIKMALGYQHQFSATNSLTLGLSTMQALGGEDRLREISGNMYSRSRNYTAANVLGESHYYVTLHYDDKQFAGVKNLKMKAGIDLVADNDADRYHVDYREANIDTTFLNYNRAYLSLFTEPFVQLQYKWNSWEFLVMERPQIYSNIQWEMMNVPSPVLLSNRTQFANIAKANIGYQLNIQHRFDMTYSFDVVRPDYKQFSSIVRLTNTEGEYLQGNDSIRPEKRHKLNFRYSYKKDDHLQTTLDVFYGNKMDKIEKVVTVKETLEKEMVTVKTFTNANVQHQVGATLRLKMNYEALEAEAWSGLAWDHITYTSGAKSKDEISYQFGLLLNAHLNKSVDLTSSMVYISPTRSAYNEKNEYIGANLRLTYKSPVGLNLFVEAKDIIDKPRTETTWNESLTYMKVKEVVENRSCLGVGISYAW